MKKCGRCKEVKSDEDFSKNKRNKDGLHSECKACDKEIKLKFRLEKPEKLKERKRNEYLRNKEKINDKNMENYWKNHEQRVLKNREYSRRPEIKDKARVRNREFKRKKRELISAKLLIQAENEKIQRKVHILVCLAVKEGKLLKPNFCENCGEKKDLQGHHEDYSKPLDVIWLCFLCHCKRHGKLMDIV